MSVREQIQKQIRTERVLIFSKNFCPHCVSAKKTLAKLDPPATVVDLSVLKDGDERQAVLVDLTGQKTVPNIFIGGNHIGGNSDLQKAIKEERVQKMLTDAGVKHDL